MPWRHPDPPFPENNYILTAGCRTALIPGLGTDAGTQRCEGWKLLIGCRRGITADTAMRLAAFIGTTPEFWINLEASYELDVARAPSRLPLPLTGACSREGPRGPRRSRVSPS